MRGDEPVIRFGIWGFAVTGLFFALGALLRGPFQSPIHPLVVDQRAFAEWVTKPGFVACQMLMMTSMIHQLLCVACLYHLLADSPARRLLLVGSLLILVGDMCYEPYLGVHAFSWPQVGQLYLDGVEEAFRVVDVGYNTAAATVVGLCSSFGYTVGSIVLGVALVRTRRFAAWVGTAFAVHGPLLGIPVMPLAPEVLGGVLLLASGVSIARTLQRELDRREPATP